MNQLSENSPVLKSGDVFAGRFKIRKPMGIGSLTTTYLCADSLQSNKDVVLKIVQRRHYRRAGFINAFTMFTKSMISIYDPRHCRVHHVGRYRGDLYFTEDYIPEVTFRFWLIKTLTFEKRVIEGIKYLKQIIFAMDVLHKRGLYASTKPENIFIRTDDVVLSDYWVAAFIPPMDFETNPPARQYLSYLAPEVKEDWSNVSPASDFFSAGAILYEILIGRPPSVNYPKPSACSELYNHEIDNIVDKALDPSPVYRYQNLGEMITSLNSLLNIFSPGELDENPEVRASSKTAGDMVLEKKQEESIGEDLSDDSVISGEDIEAESVEKEKGELVYGYPGKYSEYNPGGMGIVDMGIRAPFDEDPQNFAELNEMTWNDEPEMTESENQDIISPDAYGQEDELDVSKEDILRLDIQNETDEAENQPDLKDSGITQVINMTGIPVYPAETEEKPEKFQTNGEETVMMLLDGKEVNGPGFKKLEITDSDVLEGSSDNREPTQDALESPDETLSTEPVPSKKKRSALDYPARPVYDGSPLPQVEEENELMEDEFSLNDRGVVDIVPDPKLDTEDKVSKMRRKHTGHIPILHTKDAWNDNEKKRPMALWLKIVLIVLVILVSCGGIFIGIFYNQFLRFLR